MTPTFTLPDPRNGTTYRLYVAGATKSEVPVPGVLFMDGDDQFGAAVSGYEQLRRGDLVSELVLIGVGYGASYTKPGNFRVRDYTPTTLSTESGSGGADTFLAFLTDLLWPELAQRYRVRPDVRGLAGHSLGSLLVVHAMLQRESSGRDAKSSPPPFFNRLLASAPALWWDDRAILCAAQRLQRTGAAIPAHLFLCVGDDDTPSMTTDLELFEQQLAAVPFPELTVTSRRFPGRDHYNVLEPAFAAGLQALFAPTG